MTLNKLASEAYQTYNAYTENPEYYGPPQVQSIADTPVTYAGLGTKAGASAGALLSIGAQVHNTYKAYKASNPKVPLSAKTTAKTLGKAGISGALLWGALGGLGGGLIKREDNLY